MAQKDDRTFVVATTSRNVEVTAGVYDVNSQGDLTFRSGGHDVAMFHHDHWQLVYEDGALRTHAAGKQKS